MDLNLKIISGLERIAEVFKTLLWEKAKLHGISPIQIQILLFVSNHKLALCNVSYLSKELNVTKPTISDSVKVLVNKGLLDKDFSNADNRRYNLFLSSTGKQLANKLSDYISPISKGLEGSSPQELSIFFNSLSKLIHQLNHKGIIQVQRSCYGCQFYNGDRVDDHYCTLLKSKLENEEIRLDCPEYEAKPAG